MAVKFGQAAPGSDKPFGQAGSDKGLIIGYKRIISSVPQIESNT